MARQNGSPVDKTFTAAHSALAPELGTEGTVSDPQPEPRRKGIAIAALVSFALLEIVVALCLVPPPVRAVTAAADHFSAERARVAHQRVFASSKAHPSGGREHPHVLARLIGELEALSLAPEIQSGVSCTPDGICAELRNVVARIPGVRPGFDVVLAVHYDSVAAGPGAGDDGQGVASLLEITRALQAAPAASGVILLFTDGEELGMLGARLFVAEHPLAKEARVVVNLEARGNRGPSLMFETTIGSGWLINHYAATPRPVSSSLFGAVYRTLPNDTDLTVFKNHGWQGLNFAFVGGVEHYHTPLDTAERLDWRSVQQQGDAALATLRQIAAHGIQRPGTEAIYFDVLGRFLVRVPAPLGLVIVPLPLLGFAYAIIRALRRDRAAAGPFLRALLSVVLALAVPLVSAALLGGLLAVLGALPFLIVAQPAPLLIGLVGLTLAGQSAAWQILDARRHTLLLFDVLWIVWALVGLWLAVSLPPASYVTCVPALGAALGRIWMGRAPTSARTGYLMLASAWLAALLWLPPLSLLPGTIGVGSPWLLGGVFAFGLSPLLPLLGPLLAGRKTFLALLAGSIAIGASQLAWAPYSPDVPRWLPLVFEQEAGGRAHFLADTAAPLPSELLGAADFSPRPARPHPWPGFGPAAMYAANAPPLPDAAVFSVQPVLTRTAANTLQLEATLPPDAWALGVLLPPEVRLTSAVWRGRSVPQLGERGTHRLLFVPVSPRELSIELGFASGVPQKLELLAIGLGLPAHVEALAGARGAAAVTSGFGDLTVVRMETAVAE